jgi:threonine synthase
VSDEALRAAAVELQTHMGIDAAPEGGAALAGARALAARSAWHVNARVVVVNTGAGWLYRS